MEEAMELRTMSKKAQGNNLIQVTATVTHYHPFARPGIPTMFRSTHKHTVHAQIYTPTYGHPMNADSNCSLCAFSVERESEEWYHEEFQISKAIFHFPPSEGI